MKSILTILTLLLAFSFSYSQEVILDSQEYRTLKGSGELLNGEYSVVNPNEGVSDHVTVHPSIAGERDECDCWIDPDDTYTLANFGAQGTDDGSTNNIAFPFDFDLYGVAYTSMWINTNGTVTFDAADGTFTPTGFPNDDVMLAPFWADVDFGCADCGDLYYKVTDDAVFVNWVEVGYFNEQNDKVNSFQVIFTPEDSGVLASGNTVQFCYLDMQWTTGSASQGTNGFGGSPANVGASAGNNADYISFGEFDQEGEDYDGPFGTTDGVSWLDDQTITFNANISANENLPPIVLGGAGGDCGDTLVLCANDTEIISITFLTPESDQTLDVTADGGGFPDIEIQVEGTSTAIVTAILNSDTTPGIYTLTFTATDDGTPALSTNITFTVEVLDIEVPDLDIYYEDLVAPASISYCQGQGGVELSGTDGFDSYLWSNDFPIQTSNFTQGVYTLTAFIDGCDTQAGPVNVFEIPVFNPSLVVSDPFICSGDSSEIELVDAELYNDITWSVVNNDGEILSTSADSTSIVATPGLFQVSVTDGTACPGITVIPITEEVVELPITLFEPLCDDVDQISWAGAWANPNSCLYALYMFDNETDTWEGANIEVYIDGTGPFNFNIGGFQGFTIDGFSPFHGQVIEYYFTAGLDDDDIDVQILDENDDIVFDTTTGDELVDNGFPFFTQIANCGFNALPGEWVVDVPEGGEGYILEFTDVFNPVNGNNTFTAPAGFNGTYGLTFTADICDIVEEFDLNFGVSATVEALDYADICAEDGLLIEPIYGPAGQTEDFTYEWIPADLGTDSTAFTTENVEYTIIVRSLWCDDDQDEGTVTFIPQPTAQLFNEVLCNDEIGTLDPGPDHPSFVYDWSTGEDSPTINVSTANDYSVTVSNACGDASASAFINVGRAATVSYAPDTVLFCAGQVQVIDPVWNGGAGLANPVVWTISYTDINLNFQSEILAGNSSNIEVASEQISANSISNSVTLTYFTEEFCGDAQGSVVLELIPCEVSAPNVFTPNSDGGTSAYTDPNNLGSAFNSGLNEAWYIEGIGRLQGISVRIFDRWGSLVYENDNYSNDKPWVGENTSGNELKDGVYFYTIDAGNNIDPINGTVTIFRQ